jgi:glutamate synthase (ferredoxin)
LIREGLRTRVGLVLESGEPREVHHFSVLIGYGAGAINPYLAFETLDDMIRQGLLPDADHKTACKQFVKAATKGVIKVASKIGISTLQSYRGAQIFEAVGLNRSVIDKYFTWTASRIEGSNLEVLAKEALLRHAHAFSRSAGQRPRARCGRRVSMAQGRRGAPLQSADDSRAAERRCGPEITRPSSNTQRW